MSVSYKRENICEGAGYTEIIDKRFKTNYIYIHLLEPMDRKNASANAVIPELLHDSNEKYPTITALCRKLSSLYHAGISSGASKLGDYQVMTLKSSSIADKYTIDGENISGEVVDILLDCLTQPHLENGIFPENEFRLKKQELLDDIDAEINDKRKFAVGKARETIYKDEPAGIPVEGYREDAEKLTSADVYKRYTELLKNARIEVVFSGCGIGEADKQKIFDRIRGLDRNAPSGYKTMPSAKKSDMVYVTDRMDVNQSKMVIAYKTDCDSKQTMKMLSFVFGGTPFSMLFENVREKLSLCYYCPSGYNEKKQVLMIDCGIEHRNINPAREEIFRQLELLKNGGFSEELLANSKLLAKSSLKAVYDSPSSVANRFFSQCMDDKIVTPEEEARLIDAVTKEDIVAAANTLVPDTVYVLTGKEDPENE
ncbi:MAG: insulinase family protein [Oscillospiraceae bacterium]|nr:insulinase family protein [Oscillospiraceae bacterium]